MVVRVGPYVGSPTSSPVSRQKNAQGRNIINHDKKHIIFVKLN